MKPILFNTDMVRTILDDRKKVTRRVVKPQPKNVLLNGELVPHRRYGRCLVIESEDSIEVKHIKPPYRPGDILYVRE